ncbi:MAG TPA: hypothetical protein VMS81_08350 [Methanomicrobiales archaeon]|jgi:hypothetical protein|nr:hypothetical protein [Methanomicrobiales archaeon]
MVRNTENSDGCSVVVLGRMVVDPRPRRRDTGTPSLLPWLNGEGNEDPSPVESDPAGEPGAYPTFKLGSWRFTVKTRDLHLVEDLKAFVRDIIDLPRADAKFTFKLVRCTEDGRLAGWAWQKERVQDP